jgi:hypothetical protein
MNLFDLSVVKLEGAGAANRSMHAGHIGGIAMKDAVFSRRQVLKGAGAVGVLGALGIPASVFADDEEVELLRWDLVRFPQGLVLSGGQNMATDAATGDILTLTGSGEAAPKKGRATGGGTFEHKHANGTEVAHGVYKVTGFQSFKPAGGSLAPTGLPDGIGTIAQTMGGLLVMNIAAMPSTGGSIAGVLGIDCDLPGVEFAIHEGVHLDVLSFHFKQSGGFTLFHVLNGVNQAN